MEQTELGTTGTEVSVMGLGCMGLSGSYGPADEVDSWEAIRRAADLGVTLFDTGDFYGGGANERLLGQVLATLRGSSVVATKTGMVRTPSGMTLRGDREHLTAACDASLRRLGVDQIDLYYLARVDPTTPIEESIGAMAELVEAGKIRYVGLCEVSAETLRRAHSVHPITALQTEYSLLERHVEQEILPLTRELGISFVAYSPLSRGLLTGEVRSSEQLDSGDFRRNNPRFASGNLEHNLQLVEALEGIAAERDATPAQIALAWVHYQSPRMISIPGTRKATRVEENVRALEIELGNTDLERLTLAAEAVPAAGDRYPAPALKMVGV